MSFRDKEVNSRIAAFGIREQSVGDTNVEVPYESESANPFANDLEKQWGATPKPAAGQHCEILQAIFEIQADSQPNSLAVVVGDEKMTYAELEIRANQIARHLRIKGVGRGSIVAIILARSVNAYAAILGVLKAGGAYVPIESEYPAERARYILENSGAAAVVTTSELFEQRQLGSFGGLVIQLDVDSGQISSQSPVRPTSDEVGLVPTDLCYIIYTSGSTGRPKGVMVEHRSVCHLVSTERSIFKVSSNDRVYQGASLSFDLSIEEIWLAFSAGATLVAATSEMSRAGPELSRVLTNCGITVLSCVPTLLSMIAEDVPTIRLLILGGERCPDGLVTRFSRPGRRLVNTYGPTETTVTATYADLQPGKRVTIGRSLPGYRVHVLNETLDPVKPGETGEICIGGIGVARGYVMLPEETQARFVPEPFARVPESESETSRIYRTGDLGRIDSEGNLEFLGRVDGQVKLRGFRVELAEIEAVLLQSEGIKAAACTVREDVLGVQQLVAYVIPSNGPVNGKRLRKHLRSKLPDYMVPAHIETIAELPRLTSGKLDRASLPAPKARESPQVLESEPNFGCRPLTDTERRIAKVWEQLFDLRPVSIDDDFFLDLGGHSLLVAQMVSQLRKAPEFVHVSVADVYEHPTISSLASTLDSAILRSRPQPYSQAQLQSEAQSQNDNRRQRQLEQQRLASRPQPDSSKANRPREPGRHLLAGIIQSLGLYFVFAFRALQWVTPYLVYFLLMTSGYSVLESAMWAASSALAVFPLLIFIAIGAKWAILGRIRPGRYPLWGGYYLRWWFVQSLISALPLERLAGSPLLCHIYRLLGANIGRGVHLGTDGLAAFDLIALGDGTSVDEMASLLGYTVKNEELVIGPVHVGNGCFVGTWSVIGESAVIEDGGRLEDLSLLPSGARIPRGETWSGSPARHSSGFNSDSTTFLNPKSLLSSQPPPSQSQLRSAGITAMYCTIFLTLPLAYLVAIVPGMYILTQLDPVANPLLYLAAAPLVGATFVILFSLETIILKWVLVRRVSPGKYSVHGSFYIRNWIVDQLLNLSLDVVGPLYATLYVSSWYRALGAKIGRSVELSTAAATTPDLLEMADESTVADEASLGASRVEGGWMTVKPTRLGRRAFVGNSAVIPAGTSLGDGSLVGVLSTVPADTVETTTPNSSWLGSPPIRLPRRQTSEVFPEQKTFRPTKRLLLARGAIELLRVTLPPSGFIMVATAVIIIALHLLDLVGIYASLFLLPAVYAACCFLVLFAVAIAKWIVIGRFHPFVKPLWSTSVWRLEFVNALYEFLATPLVLEALHGTPMLPWYLRLLGSLIGRRVYIHTTGFLEFDLIEIGDRAALNEDCVMQTHLFEDRILKASNLSIGADCSVGAGSVVLYDSNLEDGSQVDALSLIMKGETLPAGTKWAGIPARWVTMDVRVEPSENVIHGHGTAEEHKSERRFRANAA